MNPSGPGDLFPKPLAAILRRLPQWPPSAVMAVALNAGLAAQLDQDALARLVHKLIRIQVRDAGIVVTLCFDGQRFAPRSSRAPVDVTITANARDYALLATRREDPDTLFFSRRLIMDGDTETGLIVKNMLDAIELEALLPRLEGLRALLPGGERHVRDEPPAPSRSRHPLIRTPSRYPRR